MSNQPASRQPPGGPLAGGAAPAVIEPNRTAEALQQLVDRAASFNLYALPDSQETSAAIRAPGNEASVIGVKIHERLHRFEVVTRTPTPDKGLTARNAVGEVIGSDTQRWLMLPEGFEASPGHEPPPTALDPTRAQRFVMLDGFFHFGQGQDGFRGFGAGQTFPISSAGRTQLWAAAIGTILEGFGRFRGHEGTYLYCGSLSAEEGFRGNLSLRVMDPDGALHTEGAARPTIESGTELEPGITYLLLRGQAEPTDLVAPRLGPGGQPIGLKVEQGLRMLYLDSSARRHGGPQSTMTVGQPVGLLSGDITFDPTAPGGTNLLPVPFTTVDTLTFRDHTGRAIGSFVAHLIEGRVFNTEIPGAPGYKAIRFGGFGPIYNGTGPFQGMTGMMTDNSLVSFTPHVSASVYVLRINDPDGKYRAAFGC